MTRKLFSNARIFTPVDRGRPVSGKEQGEIQVFPEGAILVRDGLIEAVGSAEEVSKVTADKEIMMEIDCGGACMIPGFVDPHTHMCFAARRENEFSMRLRGASYMEIHNAGGGILSSVEAVRSSSEEELFQVTLENVLSALSFGTTTLEIKSGYGLDTPSELKMLEVIRRIARETPLDIVATFMGAHAIPKEFKGDPDAYVELVIREMIPAVKDQAIAEFIDVFCEEGVFTPEQSRKIMEAGKLTGLTPKIHADEVVDTGGAAIAAQVRSISAEHLLAANPENLRSMASAGTIANLLPGTAYSLRKPYADARRMIDLGVPVALATDCNPGSCFTESMPFIFGLAVMMMNMSPEEALVASTLNSAYSINRAHLTGSLSVGKQADFLLVDGESPAIFAYHAGVSPVKEVYKLGEYVA